MINIVQSILFNPVLFKGNFPVHKTFATTDVFDSFCHDTFVMEKNDHSNYANESKDGSPRKSRAFRIVRRCLKSFSIVSTDASPVQWKLLLVSALGIFAQSLHVNTVFPFITQVGYGETATRVGCTGNQCTSGC